jgi:hypothetical protein
VDKTLQQPSVVATPSAVRGRYGVAPTCALVHGTRVPTTALVPTAGFAVDAVPPPRGAPV